jgi:4-hydroxybenzoate polyprenyltransferase
MLALQSSIGAYNDVVDARSDALTQPDKPIPAGAVDQRTASTVAIVGAAAGLAIAAAFGALALAVATVGLACGLVHSRWTKGTVVEPVPFGLGVALLPTFAWLVAAGEPPPGAGLLSAMGVIGGIALGLANAAADRDRDAAVGTMTAAVRLGRTATNVLAAALLAIVAIVAMVTLATMAPGRVPIAIAAVGIALMALGAALLWRTTARRSLAWETSALGMALLALAWLAAAAAPTAG